MFEFAPAIIDLLELHCRYSVLPALSLDGILALNIIEGAFNGEKFKAFVSGLLTKMNRFPERNSVIVMDNCSIHKSHELIHMIEEQ